LEKYLQNNQSIEWGTIIAQIITGCQYLAQNKIVHRDLKPTNIFRKDGQWKIGDFGFAKRITKSNELIIEDYKVGTPLFMPL
jgi:serine/threonine protein kinase